MSALRKHKHRVTRKANSFSNLHKLRSLNAYRAAWKGIQYDPYKKSRRWHLLMFHDSPTRAYQRSMLTDPVTKLMAGGLTDVEVLDSIAQGLPDRRFVPMSDGFRRNVSKELSRLPVKVSPDLVMAPPSPAVHPTGKSAEHLSFILPRSVMVCVRRKQRREVLLALRRGGSGNRRPKWTEESYIRC